ncbi:MAG: YbdD/YjiX family protein [Hydrogenibacillus sp.]|nr:YbdD/YjiX family protein [Hydrogenibacillus sp.]
MRAWEQMKTAVKTVSRHCKTIFGMPNYERYLEHHRTHHPDEPPMSEREYYVYALQNRYADGKANRCC